MTQDIDYCAESVWPRITNSHPLDYGVLTGFFQKDSEKVNIHSNQISPRDTFFNIWSPEIREDFNFELRSYIDRARSIYEKLGYQFFN
jgi:hypothetical protein